MTSNKLGAIIFIGGGLIFTLVAVLLFANTLKLISESKVETAIVAGYESKNDSFYPRLKIPQNDNTFALMSGSDKRRYEIGQEVEIYYNTDNPSNSIIKSFSGTWFTNVVFSTVGIVLLLLGYSYWRKSFYLNIKEKKLKKEGKRLQAEVTSVEYMSTFPVDMWKAYPYILEACFEDGKGDYRIFRSKFLQEKPDYVVGDKVDVYVDPQNTDSYLIDL